MLNCSYFIYFFVWSNRDLLRRQWNLKNTHSSENVSETVVQANTYSWADRSFPKDIKFFFSPLNGIFCHESTTTGSFDFSKCQRNLNIVFTSMTVFLFYTCFLSFFFFIVFYYYNGSKSSFKKSKMISKTYDENKQKCFKNGMIISL